MVNGSGPSALPPDSVRILDGAGSSELTEQRSRFLGFVLPAADEPAARAAVADLARRFHDARHVCHAWRVGTWPIREARNDAGEPSGTAGEPLLAALRRADVTGAVVVVVRYFGGVKLGTGGLARAYGQTAAAAIAAAPVADLALGREFRLCFPYALRRTLERLVRERAGRTMDETYAAEVTWRVWLPHSACAGFAAAVTEATAGTVTVVADPSADEAGTPAC